jgi:AhpD family alkylhydroperoxidase
VTIRYLEERRGQPAAPLVVEVYAEIRRDFGMVAEPFRVQAPAPPILAAAWAVLREGVLAGQVPRRVKEMVAAVVSQTNRCPYCVDVHTSLLHAAGGRAPAWALRRRGADAVDDPELRAIADWAAASRSPGAAILAAPPFGPAAAPELIATAAGFHYINHLVTIFLGDSPFPLGGRWLAAPSVLATSRRFARSIRRQLAPGESLGRLPPAELPGDVSWARPRPEIAAAFASLAAAVDAGAAGPLGEGAAPVRERIEAWDGQDPPLGGHWVRETVAGLPGDDRPAARLALLAALAPHSVGAGDIAEFRAFWPGERELVAVVAWAAFTAARRVAGWLDPNGHCGLEAPHA